MINETKQIDNILLGVILMVKMPDNFNFCKSAPPALSRSFSYLLLFS